MAYLARVTDEVAWASLPCTPPNDRARAQADEMLQFVVGLLADPDRFERITFAAQDDWARGGSGQRWEPANVDFGPLVAAVFCAQLHRIEPARGWDGAFQEYLARMPSWSEQSGVSAFTSPVAAAFVLGLWPDNDSIGTRLRGSLPGLLAYAAREIDSVQRDPKQLTPDRYDLIGGLAGASLVLSELASRGVDAALPLHRAATLALEELWPLSRHDKPPYWVEPQNLPTKEHRAAYPRGCTDLGVAHGVAGVLLALATLGDTHPAALRLLQAFSDAAQVRDGVVWWPNVIGHPVDASTSDRFGWCYGSPGIARPLALAAHALNHRAGQRLAARAARGIAERIVAGKHLPDPGICHGNAGLLQIMLRFANETNDEMYWHASVMLIDHIYSMFDASRTCGFSATAPTGVVSSPCLLNGALGIGLALMSAAEDIEPRWDRLLGMSTAMPVSSRLQGE